MYRFSFFLLWATGCAGGVFAQSPDPIFNRHWAHPTADDSLEHYWLLPKSYYTGSPGSFDMEHFKRGRVIVVNGAGDIRFDFGQTNAGWLEFESTGVPDSIELSISEYNEPAVVNEGAVHRFKTLAPVRHGNTYRLELNPELYEGVRFGWLHVVTHRRRWTLRDFRLVCQVKPTNYQGSFDCSDSILNRIWYTGAYTVKLNIMKDYLGAILMERSDRISWTGDAYPSQAASLVAFGNFDVVKKNLAHTATLDNGIASYALYWVLSLVDYVGYSGDTAFARAYFGNAEAKLAKAYERFEQPGNLGFYGWDERLGAGFENPDNPETTHAYQMLAIRCWKAFGRLAAALGRDDSREKYDRWADRKFEEIRSEKAWVSGFGLHAAADAVNTGMCSPAENDALYRRGFDSRVNRLSYSPFNEFFVIQALANMGRYDDALGAIRDCWGGQIAYGGTTFFEVYRPSWNAILGRNGAPVNNQCGYTSLTHPWSAGVVPWLSEEVLGIKALSPGFKKFQVIPHVGSGLTFVRGATPTGNGLICVDVNVAAGTGSLVVPDGTEAETVVIPLAGRLKAAWLNGKLLGGAGQEDGGLVLRALPPGRYHWKLIYGSLNKPVKASPAGWDYTITKFKQDSLTKGNWKGKYGQEGYVLFNYYDKGKNLERIPSFVSRIRLNKQGDTLGAIVTRDPTACQQTMTMDIGTTDTAEHRIALYFLDWDGKGRRSAVEVFDLGSLNLIAPVQMIRNYRRGKYLVFRFHGSIRLRIDQVRGDNAAMSGVFFD
ncbi:MAG TPA: alpha-L-rhamnosidase C-terminal domain-containing protein [Dinghuibacter sp.]|uniref:alpha-L-rhamnosidase-related protein n=1 Tax=Dinghuibacter sp. TaxID=2024697 RepID=UPI002C2ABF02|nr:alpha-L-rhamnosidase C-terminal domain-containing protein [Dinghuibacter sp.]HTJ12625.1 alpha-L-rhamnosidase C-terminal domain-containing protein [Dinghuibacter sp.]